MKVLIVDDELSMREYLEVLLQRAGYDVDCAESLASARELLRSRDYQLVISDMKLGGDSGMDVLRLARSGTQPPEVLLITAFGTPSSAVQAMREGAYDYICKPFDNDELLLLVEKALEKRTLRSENKALREIALGPDGTIIGNDGRMAGVFQLVERVAGSRTTVLVCGESGTGKEMIAKAIHYRGPRAVHPFLPVNCAALAEGVLESELFGHTRGAFTGAATDRKGILVAAGEGTVLLDEIGEILPSTQVKLLRVLQEKKVKPVGSSSEVPFNARIIAATNRNLEQEVRAGRFREDLYYRLNVITLELPPLRARRDDIPALAEHFLRRMREELGRPELSFAPETIAALSQYSFPGNIRQLENIIERAATLAEGDVLRVSELPAALRGEAPVEPKSDDVRLGEGFSLDRLLDEAERRHLVEALRAADGVKTRAAVLLGLTFRSFRYRLAKHGLEGRDEHEA